MQTGLHDWVKTFAVLIKSLRTFYVRILVLIPQSASDIENLSAFHEVCSGIEYFNHR
jgi:hypothetical protein